MSVQDRPGRLRIGIVSAGRVGAVLGHAWQLAGHDVVAVAAVSQASRQRAQALLPAVAVREVPDVVVGSDLVLLAVPDDVLPGLVQGLADAEVWQPGQLVVHTAGRYSFDVLDAATTLGAIPLALHPAMTFTGTSVDVARLTDCCVAVTAPDVAVPIGEALAIELGAEPLVVSPEQRPMYHAALSHAASHLMTLVSQSLDVLRVAGIEPADRVLAPLVSAALDNVLRSGDAALTGPVVRGDANTVSAHVAALAEATDGEGSLLVATYRALARATADRALAAGMLPTDAAPALLAALAES